MSIVESNTEVEILARAIVPESGDLSEDVARVLLEFKLDPRDQERVQLLVQKNRNDELSVEEGTNKGPLVILNDEEDEDEPCHGGEP